MTKITKSLMSAAVALSGAAMAYVPDRCDWQDCGALARGESDGGGWGLLIVFAIVFFYHSKKQVIQYKNIGKNWRIRDK